MTDPIDDIRRVLGPIDPALRRSVPSVPGDKILRSILDDAGPAPTDHRPPKAPRPTTRRRRELVSCLALVAVVAGVVTFRLSSSAGRNPSVAVAGRTVADRGGIQTSAPSGPRSPDDARLLPPAGASIGRLVTSDLAVDSTYQQRYLGDGSTNPPQLVLSTIDVVQHRSGSSLLSESMPSSHQTVKVGSHRAALRSAGGRIFLWWMEPDGVEVDVTATNLATSEVVHALTHAKPSRTSRLGLDVGGVLPAGLHLVAAVLTNQPGTAIEELDYRQGTCDAQLEVFNNVDGQSGPASGTTRAMTVSGHPGLLTTDHDAATVVWAPIPGFTAQLSAPAPDACDAAALAQQVHRVTPAQWAVTFTQLGAKAQHVPATPEFR